MYLIRFFSSVYLVSKVLSYQAPFSKPIIQPKTTLSSTSPLFRQDFKGRNALARQNELSLPDQTRLFSSMSTTDEDVELDSDDSVEEEGLGAWIPFASCSSLKGLGPQRITTMNVDFVVWHTPEDDKKEKKRKKKNGEPIEEVKWTVQLDACTHRLAPLSQGRVDPESACIECPYHGWQFDCEGNLNALPQLDKGKSVEKVQQKSTTNVKTFPTHIVGDLMFVFLPSSLHGEMFLQSLLPEQYYPFLDGKPDDHKIFVRDLPYSVDFLVENFMDPAHIPFAHHKLQSTRDDGSPIEIDLMSSNFTHVQFFFKDVSGKRNRDAYASFQRPAFYHFSQRKGELKNEETMEREGDFELTLPIFVAPVSAGRCRLFLEPPKIKRVPTWLLHAGSNRFLNSDSWLHDTEREAVRRKELLSDVANKAWGLDYQYQSKSDRGVSFFRRWWEDNGMANAPSHTYGMATMEQLGSKCLTRYEQIDPWEYHAKHCSKCRDALAKMKKLQTASLFLSLLSVIVGRRKPLLAIIGAGVGLLGNNFFKKCATLIEGNPERSRVNDRSAAAAAP